MRLDPSVERFSTARQSDQKSKMNKASKEQMFTIEEQVVVQIFGGEPKRLDSTVTETTTPFSYKGLVGDQLWMRHVDQMHQTQVERPDRSAGVSETFPRSSDSKQIVDVQPISATFDDVQPVTPPRKAAITITIEHS